MPKTLESRTTQRIRVSNRPKTELRVLDINLNQCRPNPKQPRKYFNETAIQDLAASIERHGLIQPITVTRDPKNKQGFLIIAGERRFRAFQHLKRQKISAILSNGNSDEIALIENLQRENLNPLEEAEALLKLQKKYNYTHEELGKAVGKARSTITNYLKLTTLPQKIKRESSSSNLATKSFLMELSKLKDPKQQLTFWEEAKNKGITVKEARARKNPKLEAQEQRKKILRQGEAFIKELEQVSAQKEALSNAEYERLLGIFKRLVSFLDD